MDFRKIPGDSEKMLSCFVSHSNKNWEVFFDEVIAVMRTERNGALEQVRKVLHEEIKLWSKRGHKFVFRSSPQGIIDEIQDSMCRLGNRISEIVTGKPVPEKPEPCEKRRRKRSRRRP